MKNIVYVKNAFSISQNEGRLRFKNVITKEEHFMYCDELSVLVLENKHSFIRTDAVNALLGHNVLVLYCNEKFTPVAILSGDFGHSNKLHVMRRQMLLNKKTKDRLWQKIIKYKIENQRKVVICYTAYDIEIDGRFTKHISNVQIGDETAREAVAARLYFDIIFGLKFIRGRYDDKINASLNYGYAVLRAVIRKTLVIHGFEPCLGIKHSSGENPFNLADDIIEPYRPFVDAVVLQYIIDNGFEIFRREDRLILTEQVLTLPCLMEDKSFTVHDAIDETIKSLSRCYDKNSSSGIMLPRFIEP